MKRFPSPALRAHDNYHCVFGSRSRVLSTKFNRVTTTIFGDFLEYSGLWSGTILGSNTHDLGSMTWTWKLSDNYYGHHAQVSHNTVRRCYFVEYRYHAAQSSKHARAWRCNVHRIHSGSLRDYISRCKRAIMCMLHCAVLKRNVRRA